MNQVNLNKPNVVSLFDRGAKSQKSAPMEILDIQPVQSKEFETIIKRNLENQQRMQKERAKANRSVLKSYRIKN